MPKLTTRESLIRGMSKTKWRAHLAAIADPTERFIERMRHYAFTVLRSGLVICQTPKGDTHEIDDHGCTCIADKLEPPCHHRREWERRQANAAAMPPRMTKERPLPPGMHKRTDAEIERDRILDFA
jgi:hypothetical protein